MACDSGIFKPERPQSRCNMAFKQQKIDRMFRRARGDVGTSRDPPDPPEVEAVAIERPGPSTETNDSVGGQRRSARLRTPASYYESDGSNSDEEWMQSGEEEGEDDEDSSDQGKNNIFLNYSLIAAMGRGARACV